MKPPNLIKRLKNRLFILPARYIAIKTDDAIHKILRFCKDVNFIKFHCMYINYYYSKYRKQINY